MYDFEFEELLIKEDSVTESVKQDAGTAESKLTTVLQHMIKYKYQPSKQDKSWCNSIGDSYNQYIDTVNNSDSSAKSILNKMDLDKCYKDARNKALKETNLPQATIPKERPTEWDINYITNYDNIISFLKDSYNPNATYNFKDEDEMVEFMRSKLK